MVDGRRHRQAGEKKWERPWIAPKTQLPIASSPTRSSRKHVPEGAAELLESAARVMITTQWKLDVDDESAIVNRR